MDASNGLKQYLDGEIVNSRQSNPIDIERGETHLTSTKFASKSYSGACDQIDDDTNNNSLTQFTSVSHDLNGRNNTFTAVVAAAAAAAAAATATAAAADQNSDCNIVHANETSSTHTSIQAPKKSPSPSANVNELAKPVTANGVQYTSTDSTNSNINSAHIQSLLQQPSHTNTVTTVTTPLTPPPPSASSSLPHYTESNSKQKLSNKAVSLLRRSTPIGVVVISCILAISIAISVCTMMGWDYTVPAIVCGVVAILASSGLWYWLYIAALTAPRDIRALYRYIKLLTLVKRCHRKNVAIADVFHQYVAKHPQKACFIYEGREWSFREVNELSNRVANLFQQNGYKKNDVIGLFMENRPEFVCIWLGLSKIGVIVPLINTNLRQTSLLHSIQIAKCQALIYGESLTSAVNEIADQLTANADSFTFFQFNDEVDTTLAQKYTRNLGELLQAASKMDVVQSDAVKSSNTHHDQLLYIYTSGTTGLPKAAVITHSRYIFIAAGIHYMADFKPEDIFYTPLPLYHTAGGVMSVGQALLFGSTVVIRKKFSASGYFPDCQKYKCTVAQYIGEMCRYILATPSNPADTNHNVRVIFGNGLRPQIWPQFVKRFNIGRVAEFYGATEGNANIVNINNVVGAIGFVSKIIPSVYPISIIKADPATGEPIRDSNGLCQLCEPNEPGVFVGKIMPNNPSRAFLGYVDKAASSKKIVRDVFHKGDSAFLSGDLLVSDEYGNLYFKDRTGDTFRWKGENVSTSEVEAQVSNVAGYRDTVVYGVEIPNTEGRAGMAAILDVDNKVDLNALAAGLKSVLPTYARPQFIRLLRKVDMTGTFKLKKLDLQKEGFDPNKIDDSLYYMAGSGKYTKLDKAIYEEILNGNVRF